MRRVVVALGLITALAGCSSPEPETETGRTTVVAVPSEQAAPPVPQVTETPSPSVRETTRPSRSPQAKRAAEPPVAAGGNAGLDRFLAAVRTQVPTVALDRREEEVEELGETACDGLSAGRSKTTVARELSEHGVTSADARKLVSLAGDTVCGTRPKV
ncbi:hypothetical protein GCM10010172_08420 [Paractinoplanes ferrugineus]|uniref:DUF732 domain-containing protein n=1 Tax=Paractinoplanes ferrugineus TaxID=113564 RepID=A0A919MK39_9ACTN|nr:DUF732 domain-containing protein [Actinoplanes ferrugineus]GIE15375.1 hypothetical protein Afe05nite_72150 [Actinoplanes ferrugineus]